MHLWHDSFIREKIWAGLIEMWYEPLRVKCIYESYVFQQRAVICMTWQCVLWVLGSTGVSATKHVESCHIWYQALTGLSESCYSNRTLLPSGVDDVIQVTALWLVWHCPVTCMALLVWHYTHGTTSRTTPMALQVALDCPVPCMAVTCMTSQWVLWVLQCLLWVLRITCEK